MKGLLFLARLALICNGLFLFCLVMQRMDDFMPQGSVKSTIIVLGWFVAPFVNLAASLWFLSVRVLGKPLPLPGWLAISNLLFLVLQFFVYFILAS
ncbi:MAG: hypothetical protein IM598_01150 [Chitinophagaceae bacterium]|nr:hypothetical protein [Bacteroidota bacterium]MCA6449299.1 hypothetical protein [Chitinophagaceae bacterium]MCA6451799.1 hypothetical protein [Chitinophagaceae bacterium]MCA6457692.1 hypothetical protein [Chitinophagaceae bacterium]MCA6463405.1 hypothetical protein [Chitinophagaceae bacterium]